MTPIMWPNTAWLLLTWTTLPSLAAPTSTLLLPPTSSSLLDHLTWTRGNAATSQAVDIPQRSNIQRDTRENVGNESEEGSAFVALGEKIEVSDDERRTGVFVYFKGSHNHGNMRSYNTTSFNVNNVMNNTYNGRKVNVSESEETEVYNIDISDEGGNSTDVFRTRTTKKRQLQMVKVGVLCAVLSILLLFTCKMTLQVFAQYAGREKPTDM